MIIARERARSFIPGGPLTSLAQSFMSDGVKSLEFYTLPVILQDNPSIVVVRSNWPNNPGVWCTSNVKNMPPIIFPRMGCCSHILAGKGNGQMLFGHLSENTLAYGGGGIERLVRVIQEKLGEKAVLDLYRLHYPFNESNKSQFVEDFQKGLGDKLKIKQHNILFLSREREEEIDVAYSNNRLAQVFNYQPSRSKDASEGRGWVSISSDG